jgi:phage protein D
MPEQLKKLLKTSYFKISISGEVLDEYKMSLINEVTFEDNASGSSILQISINDPDRVFIEDKFFVQQAPIHFEGGWVGERPATFDGFISVIDIDFPEEGYPVLMIHCMDRSHLMNRVRKKRTWKKTKVSEVARAIFREHGLVPIIDDSGKVEDTVSQSHETDIEFLISKAEGLDNEFIAYVEGNNGYFVKKNYSSDPQAVLNYASLDGSIYSFRPRVNKESKPESVDKTEVSHETKKVVKDKTTNNKSPRSKETQYEFNKNTETWKKI